MDRDRSLAVNQRRYRIVIAVDTSQYAEIVLEHGLDQAARHDSPDLHILTVVEDRDAKLDPFKGALARLVLEGLDAFRTAGRDWRTRLHVRVGDPTEEIPLLAAEVDADLLVIGRYGVHPGRQSIADQVLPRASCPTLIVGLTGHVDDPGARCAACAAVREASDGERWFCAEHASDTEMRLSTLVPFSSQLTHGGPLW